MAVNLTNRTVRNLREVNIEPNLIVKFEGLDTLFSAIPVTEFIKIGQPDLYIDGTWFIGGFLPLLPEDNKTLVDNSTTSYSIKQQINHDEGKESSVANMVLGLVDKDQYVSELISPGFIVDDMLGRKAQVFATFGTGSFFEDAVEYFRGFVTSITSGPGLIKFKLNHPDNKKQVSLFKKTDTSLTAGLNASVTTIPVTSTDNFLDASGDFLTYIRINDEIMQYLGRDAINFLSVVRGQLGTTAAPHTSGDTVAAQYTLQGNPLDLALQLMLSGSGIGVPAYEDVPITSFVRVGSGSEDVANSIFFREINIPRDYGLRIGDTVTITGAINGSNNVTTSLVTDVQIFEDGYYVVLSDTLIIENPTSAVADFFCQYNVLPDGMRMTPDEVDITRHTFIRDTFHSSTEFQIFLKEDEVDGKEFIDEQLYKPIACYALNRKARASVGFTVGPIPGTDVQTINIQNIKNPQGLDIIRTTNRSFFNEAFYKYDDTPSGDANNFTKGFIQISQDSKNRIPGTTKTYVVESQGLKTALNADNIVQSNSQRVIDRYKFGAEIVKGKATFRDFAGIEIGDIVIFEGVDLQVTDITKGTRAFKSRLFELLNRDLDLKTGDVSFSALDTGLNLDTRYGLMSPCSPIASVISQQQVVIGPDALYPSKFGLDEYRKWENAIGINDPVSVLIRNADWTITEDAVVTNITGNTFTFANPIVTTLLAGYMIEFTGYVDTDTSDKQKLLYGYMTDAVNFPDNEFPYLMI